MSDIHNNEGNQSVCVHTLRITDCCLDKDCIEDLRVYLTAQSQAALEASACTKVRSAELLYVHVNVESLAYKDGYFAVDLTYYYRIIGEALQGALRPLTITGLSIFSKRTVLYGGKSKAKIFRSDDEIPTGDHLLCPDVPLAVAEALDPMILSSKIKEVCECRRCESTLPEIPECISCAFGEEIVTNGETKRLYISIGQFSTIRLERDAQLSICAGEYCAPTRECCEEECCEEDPCELFNRIDFPMQAFFPETNSNC